MFLSNELISLVFANDGDTYYGADLLTLNLQQYLWKNLHHDYQAVYFLKADKDCFSVSTYGDIDAIPFKPMQQRRGALIRFHSGDPIQSQFQSWLLEQMCREKHNAAAFVCPLDDFCFLLADSDWTPLLTQLAELRNRTGIFVLTASSTVEKTQNLLLSCSVFDSLQDTAITMLRSSMDQNLYETLQKYKNGHCVFLNAFTKDRIRNMLLHLCFKVPGRFESLSSLELLTDYLYMYLHDPVLELIEPLKTMTLPPSCMTHQELYELLSEPSVWRGLTAQAEQYHRAHKGCPPAVTVPDAPMHRARNGFAGKLMAIQLPGWVISAPPDNAFPVLNHLESIRPRLAAPLNQVENQMMAEGIRTLTERLATVAENDLDTYKIILEAIDFCVGKLYLAHDAHEYDRVQEILSHWHSVINTSINCFKAQNGLKRYPSSHGAVHTGNVQARMVLQTAQSQFDEKQAERDDYLALIRNHILELDVLTPISSIPAVKNRIAELQKASRNNYDDRFFEFNENDYRTRPPE